MSTTPTEARGSGHAKLILFGEHAVVYGKPAVAAGLRRGARAVARPSSTPASRLTLRGGFDEEVLERVEPDDTGDSLARAFFAILSTFNSAQSPPGRTDTAGPVELEVTLEVPVGVGLGSSAAFAVATARALAAYFDQPEVIDDAVRASEEVFHGSPSGIDQIAATEGGLLFFSRSDHTEVAPIEAPSMTLAVCQAGPAASTAEIVANVRALKGRRGELVDLLNMLIGDTARAAAEALRAGDWPTIGELMNINHGALCALGVSTAALDAACHAARDAGATGAKLTGAGGGGCVVALTPDGADDVLAAWRQQGWRGFEVTIGRG